MSVDVATMTEDDYLRVPYVLMLWSTRWPSGTWVRHAEYPELPGCVVEHESTTEVLRLLDEQRVRFLQGAFASGEKIPLPRPPLRA